MNPSSIMLQSQGVPADAIDSLFNSLGINLFEEDIDNVIFQTNEFLTDSGFVNDSGPFWWILEMCMALGALFAIIMAAGMAYKMMVKGEPFDVLKILRVLGIAIVMSMWYPSGNNGASVLGVLAYIPNCIGSYTHDLYEIEADQVQGKFKELTPLINRRDSLMQEKMSTATTAKDGTQATADVASDSMGADVTVEGQKVADKFWIGTSYAGLIVCIDKLMMMAAVILFRFGWWATIYCQQIILGMLTIFGPIQWAFSILPKWEGAWAKWITRYLTVHFYGAMLYFVGFYVLLLFDVVLSVQVENLSAILHSTEEFNGYLHNTFVTAAYLLVASLVSVRCLNLVPDLAAWMIPEGDTAFSTRNFGEGVASAAKQSAMSLVK